MIFRLIYVKEDAEMGENRNVSIYVVSQKAEEICRTP
jgi:hypothetical protein